MLCEFRDDAMVGWIYEHLFCSIQFLIIIIRYSPSSLKVASHRFSVIFYFFDVGIAVDLLELML